MVVGKGSPPLYAQHLSNYNNPILTRIHENNNCLLSTCVLLPSQRSPVSIRSLASELPPAVSRLPRGDAVVSGTETINNCCSHVYVSVLDCCSWISVDESIYGNIISGGLTAMVS